MAVEETTVRGWRALSGHRRDRVHKQLVILTFYVAG